MTPQSFKCFQALIDADVDPAGWGATQLFPFACSRHCMGILDETTMYDSDVGSYGYGNATRGAISYIRKYSVPEVEETRSKAFGLRLDPIQRCQGTAPRHVHQYPFMLHFSQVDVWGQKINKMFTLNECRL